MNVLIRTMKTELLSFMQMQSVKFVVECDPEKRLDNKKISIFKFTQLISDHKICV